MNNLTSHMTPISLAVDCSNEQVHYQQESEHQACINKIKEIVSKGYSPSNGTTLINYLQSQRTLLMEIMMESFTKKPNPKMADSINTLMGQMEKSVRDDRKEALRAKEMETSKETFDLFRQSLEAVFDGSLVVPTFERQSLILDPLTPLLDDKECDFKPGELEMGIKEVDIKSIEQKLYEVDNATEGSGTL